MSMVVIDTDASGEIGRRVTQRLARLGVRDACRPERRARLFLVHLSAHPD
jgi:NAD(P)-dependent dehydrogenase (short-subunit alcohol dehydrogenase family)